MSERLVPFVHVLRASGLLDMLYSPDELADELQLTVATITNTLLPAGMPHGEDEKGTIWLRGPEVYRWLNGQSAGKNLPGAHVSASDELINRSNYQAVKQFIEYQREVMQRDSDTLSVIFKRLKHLLRWAKGRAFIEAHSIRPVFPQHLLSARTVNPVTGKAATLEKAGLRQTCLYARMFFNWLRDHVVGCRKIDQGWIDTIQPPRIDTPAHKEREAVTLSMVEALLALPCAEDDVRLKRDKAAAAFLFLSGMRARAFCTLPIRCVDVGARRVRQIPAEGVATKNRKAAVTTLHGIPGLLSVVTEWDTFVRERLPDSAPWWPDLESNGRKSQPVSSGPSKTRRQTLKDCIYRLFDLAGLPRRSPHKFRHGHAVYGIGLAQDIGDLKAVSQNLMHSSITITDGVYAILNDDDVERRIAQLGKKRTDTSQTLDGSDIDGLIAMLQSMKVSRGAAEAAA